MFFLLVICLKDILSDIFYFSLQTRSRFFLENTLKVEVFCLSENKKVYLY